MSIHSNSSFVVFVLFPSNLIY